MSPRLLPVAIAVAAGLLAARDDPFAGRIAGKPVNCISLSTADGPTILDENTIIYRQSGRRLWRTQPIGRCPALRPLTTLITTIYGSQLCRNDQFRVLEPGVAIPSNVCRFDRFVPYDRP